MNDKRRVPPIMDEPFPPSPPSPKIDMAPLVDAFNQVVDSLANALETSGVTNRVLKTVGIHERGHGLSTHTHRTWLDMLGMAHGYIAGVDPDTEGEQLDAWLIETAALCVRWIKQRERQRREAQQ